ncbi:hypothetical protein SAMN05428949_0102 [Chitinophaga sp. YR627]|nr:hypothetical protein SAMN05428949_0102 [Chitinophaga sp. YR627]
MRDGSPPSKHVWQIIDQQNHGLYISFRGPCVDQRADVLYFCCMKHKVDKKDLKKRLSFVMMAQFDGLNEKGKEKLQDYLDKQLDKVADFYKEVLKKQQQKDRKKAAATIIAHNEALLQPAAVPESPAAAS